MIARISLATTDDDLVRISSENPSWRVERTVDGTLTMTPPSGSATAKRNSRLTRILDEWAEAHSYVAFDSSGGFRLPDTSVVGPDGALVPNAWWERLSAREQERFFPGAPEVAIELCSDSDNPNELRAKLERIRMAGASYVVRIDPYRRVIWTGGTPPAAFDLDFTQLLK